jgi:phosphate uptake regulator
VLPALSDHQQTIDSLYPRMEATVSWEITKQAPVASDLRFLLSVLTIARDFERAHRSIVRLGDHAVNVTNRVRYLAGSAPD